MIVYSVAIARSLLQTVVSTPILLALPTGLPDARDAALIGEFPETNATNAEFLIHSTWPAAEHAAVHFAGRKLGRPLGGGDL